jgi:hypothetical protein
MVHFKAPAAAVTALDPSAGFLSALSGEHWCTTVVGTDADLDAGSSFDVAVSSLALMFCPSPEATLANLRRVAPRLALTVLGPARAVEPFCRYWGAVAEVVDDAWPPDRYPHHRFAARSALGAAARGAGWRRVRVEQIEVSTTVDPVAAWDWLHNALPVGVGEAYAKLDAGQLDAVRQRFVEGAPAAYVSRGWLLTARR